MHNTEHNQPKGAQPRTPGSEDQRKQRQQDNERVEPTRGRGTEEAATDETTAITDREVELQTDGNLGNERNRNR
jgi:hypothetical protein